MHTTTLTTGCRRERRPQHLWRNRSNVGTDRGAESCVELALRVAGWLPHPGWGVRVWAAVVRRGHDRLGHAGFRAPTPELVTLTVDGREVSVPKGTGLVEAALAAGRRDSRVLLRAAARAARRRLPDVPLRGRAGAAEAAGRLHADRGRGDGGQDRAHLGDGGRGAERDARVHPRQPPARLPGLRQGRRVPAPGPDVPLRPRQHPDGVREAHVREADPDLADDRPRPRALHPLLPLHALLGVGRRGRAARRGRARCRVDDRHLRRRALPRPVLRQRDRALPGRRAHLDPVPLRGPPLGDPERRRRSAASARSAATSAPRPARARSSGSSRATIPRSTRAGSATRAASPSRTSTPATGSRIRSRRPQRGFEPLEWTDALDKAEAMLRAAGTAIITALSGSETVEQAYGLARLLRAGLGAHGAVLPEDVPDGLDAFRAPLSAIRDAKTVVVLCDEPVVERAPVVDLWIKAARRNGAHVTDRAARRAGRRGRPDQRRPADRRLGRPRARRDRRVLPPAHPERPRRHRRLELRRRRRAGRRGAEAPDRLRRRGRDATRPSGRSPSTPRR